ncbi:MAG: transposase [Phycisphaerae bacterium]
MTNPVKTHLHGTDAVGQVIRRGRCPNVFSALAEWFAPLERRAKASGEEIRVVLEGTTHSRAMRQLLVRYAEEAELEMSVDVLHARKLRIITESVAKCDALDAAVLNQLARSNLTLPTCYMPDDEVFALREHLRARSDLVRMRLPVV